MKSLILALLLFLCGIAKATTYYVSPTGNDNNPGTIVLPFKNLQKLNAVLEPGDIAYIRSGTYTSTYGVGSPYHCIYQNLNGTQASPIIIQNYPGETVIFDLNTVGVPTTCYVYCLFIEGCSWLTVKGITIRNMRQVADGCGISRGLVLNNSQHCTIEQMEVYNMGGYGFLIENGSNDNLILNCDAHHNGDGLSDGGGDAWDNADAFGCTSNNSLPADNSTRNIFRGCRGWLNSDDGWDFFGINGEVHLENCWSFWNGYKPWGTSNSEVTPSEMTPGDPAIFRNNPDYIASSGEGIKLGPARVQEWNITRRFVQNCMSVENLGTGFASNSDGSLTTRMQLWNNIAYSNGNDGFSFGAGWSAGVAQIFQNNWAWNNNQVNSGGNIAYDGLPNSLSNNCWMPQNYQNAYGNIYPSQTISNADFLTVSSVGLDARRQSDGSLPVLNFLKLAPTSDLINKGVDVGLPYNGTAPDVGAFEYGTSAVNTPPTANANTDQSITLPVNSVTLTGSATDPDGTITAYQWAKISGPATANFSSSLSATTNVTELQQGVYKFELKVTDNNGAIDRDTVQVTVNAAVNQPPVANAGTDQAVTLPIAITSLNGSGIDPDGTIVSYQWTKISGPTPGTLTSSILAITTVTGLVQGVYKFQLKVTDNSGATDLDTMQLSVNLAVNQPPVANAGTDQSITLPTNSVSLSGSGTDPDGTIAAYQWTKISGPAAATITSTTTAATTVTAMVQGTYKFELKVTDNNGATGTDTIQVTVNSAANQAPTAIAGNDQVITLPANTVSLSGSGIDPDGTITAYRWRKISGPSGYTITNTTSASTTVTGLVQGIYGFEFRVTDNSGATGFDTVQVTVNAAPNLAPTANAGTDQNITLPISGTTLSGSGNDQDGTIISYSWTQVSGPASATITNAGASTTTVTGLMPGIYQFQLEVTDNDGATDTDIVTITVHAAVNQLPVADAGANQTITLPVNIITLSGSGNDPDGTIVSYSWTQLSGPADAIITNATTATTAVTGLLQGIYQFQLLVTDNSGATDTDIMQVNVNAAPPPPNQAPLANAGLDQNITLPTNTASLSGSGTDPDGTITAYLWRKISGPANGTIASTTAAITAATGLVQGTYKFELKVTDNSGATARDTMQVTVNVAINQPPLANAGSDKILTLPANSISFTGSGTDPDGFITAYQWTKVSGPTPGTINNAASATISVTGLVQGVYKFQLRVTDNSGATDPDTMQVTVTPAVNQSPTAEAGVNQAITLPTNSITLSGSGIDPDGTITAYSWIKLSGPAGGTISNAGSATTTVTGLVQGIYQFLLQVTDNNGATDTDVMQVNVNAAVNQLPVANAGLDQNITLPTSTASLSGSGTDPDGTITAYQWTKISGPTAGTISNTVAAATTATGLVQGIYKFQLRVTDNSGATDTDTMQVTVNAAANQLPVANAGLDQNITLPTSTASLSGSGTDPDGTITAYQWTKISGPTAGTISNAASAATTATGLVQGIYKFQLRVTDNSGATDTDTMQVTVNAAANQLPVANAGPDRIITLPTNTASLSGSGTDPDGTITAYLWTKISGPTAGAIANINSATTSATGLVQGVYKFQLRVTDNSGATDTDTMQVTVNAAPPPPNEAPTANAGADSSIYLPANTISLSGTGTDPDGTIVSYNWQVIAGGPYTFTNTGTTTPALTDLQQGIYEVELTVTDNSGATGKDTVVIAVGAARTSPPMSDDVRILGNPVQNKLLAEISSSTDQPRPMKLLLYNINGTTLYERSFRLNHNIQLEEIDMSRYSRGTYILQVYFDKTTPVVKKVIKM